MGIASGNLSGNGSDNLSDNGSKNGSSNGSKNGSDNGSENGSDNGANNGSGNGSYNGSGNNAHNNCDNDSNNNTHNNCDNGSYNNQGNNSHNTFNVTMPSLNADSISSSTNKFLASSTSDVHNVALNASSSLKSATNMITTVGNDAKLHMDHADTQLTTTSNAIIDTTTHVNSAVDSVGSFSVVAQHTLEHARYIASIAIQAGMTMLAVFAVKKLFDRATSAEDPMLTATKRIAAAAEKIADNTSAGVVNRECDRVLIRARQICREHESKRVYLFIPCTIIRRQLDTELADIKSELQCLQLELNEAPTLSRVIELHGEIKTPLKILRELRNLAGWYSDIDELLDEAVIDRLTELEDKHNRNVALYAHSDIDIDDLLEEAVVDSDIAQEHKPNHTYNYNHNHNHNGSLYSDGCVIFFYTPVPYITKRILCIPPIGKYLITSDTHLHSSGYMVHIGGILNTDRLGMTSRMVYEKTYFDSMGPCQDMGRGCGYPREKTWVVIPGDPLCTNNLVVLKPVVYCEFGDADAYNSVDHKTINVSSQFSKEYSLGKHLGLSFLAFITLTAIHFGQEHDWDHRLIRAHRVPCGRNCKPMLNICKNWNHKDCEKNPRVNRLYQLVDEHIRECGYTHI